MIPVNTPLLSGNEKKYINEALDTGWISSEGPFVKKFEEQFSSYIGRKNGVAVSNGSAALDIAVKAIGINKGDEVILPTFTIISPAFSIIRQGGIPVLVDSDPITWGMDVSKIEEKITANTKAILVVHIYGYPVDMDPVIELANKYELKIIEDAAEMHGQTYKGKKCGSFGDISIFSFYPNKHITTGEGGMILTDNNDLSEKCKELRNLCFIPPKRFVHKEMGWNYRMTNLQAALGVAQLEQIEQFIERKREIGSIYNELLKNVANIDLMPKLVSYSENIYWVYGIILKPEQPKNAEYIINELKKQKIGSRPFFFPMHLQPIFQKMGLFKNQTYPVSENLSENGFYIPCGLGIKNEEISLVVKTLKKILLY